MDPHTPDLPEENAVRWDRIFWVLALAVLTLIPLRIMSYGYLPPDDALRHAAKAVTGRPWPEIILMRPDLQVDHHIGWHTLLGALHRGLGWNADALVAVALVIMPISVLWAGLLDRPRRPEGWLLACLAGGLFSGLIHRIMLARPFVLSMGMTILVLSLWTRGPPERRFRARVAGSAAALALATWIHGSCWYLFPLVLAAFIVSRQWRRALGIGVSWVAGTLIGALMTGEPVTFLWGHFKHALLAFGRHELTRTLVVEFQPSDGLPAIVLLTLGLIGWRVARRGRAGLDALARDPVFLVAVFGWLASLKVLRFWLDWGLPAYMLWIAREWSEGTEELDDRPAPRFALTAFAGIALFLSSTSDIGGRWTSMLTREYLEMDNERLAGWLPEPGGIFYSDSMTLFYDTFYTNPEARWRYALAYEPGLMPPEDLEIYRHIQWNYHADKSYAAWVEKMRPGDRLVLSRSKASPPGISKLEWLYGATGVWIGRLPPPPDAENTGLPPDAPAKPETSDKMPETDPAQQERSTLNDQH